MMGTTTSTESSAVTTGDPATEYEASIIRQCMRPGGIVPVDLKTTAALCREVARLRTALQMFVAACDTAPPIAIIEHLVRAREAAGAALKFSNHQSADAEPVTVSEADGPQ